MTHSIPEPALEIPHAWQADLAGYSWEAQTIGRSSATVFRLEASGRPTLFAKTESLEKFAELPGEASRLRWLAANGIACPMILAETREVQRCWLLMNALPGRVLASSQHLGPERIAEIAADALRCLHRLDVTACPFNHRLDQRINDARTRMDAGLVNETDFDEERQGRRALDLFEELLARRPEREDLVVAHGDAYLANMLADDGGFAGFVDCARLGVADRYQDLALAVQSIGHCFGELWVNTFLRRYGVTLDRERLEFYLLLDEFF